MSRSTRFPVAVHILTVLAVKKGEYVNSNFIAKSVATNRVVVRRVLSMLQEAGFVTSQTGLYGGAKLAVKPSEANLLDVYRAVEEGSIFRLHTPYPKCPIAGIVKDKLGTLLAGAESAMEQELAGKTLEDVVKPAMRAFRKYVEG